MNKKVMIGLLALLGLSGCLEQPQYSEKISECVTQAHEAYKRTFKIHFTSNPVQECFDKKVVRDAFSPLLIQSSGKQIDLNSIDKPIYLQTFSYQNGQSLREKPYINEMAEKYSEQVEFIVLVRQKRAISEIEKAKFPDIYQEFNSKIKVVWIKEEAIDELEEGYGELIYGIRNVNYPTTYYISKDKKILKVSSLEELMVQTNIIFMDNEHLSDQELSKRSFYKRVPNNIEQLLLGKQKNNKI